MDISTESAFAPKRIDIENSLDGSKTENSFSFPNSPDILDLSGLDFNNDETWLYEPKRSSATDYNNWLQKTPFTMPFNQENSENIKLKSSKVVDTRTFTRPKKKLLRPSIMDLEQFQPGGTETILENQNSKSSEEEYLNGVPKEPLHFDLSQPASINHFESMINSIDSFQNMSPPSLVNSLCSSTFANLMESSFIKNDPVLREIRDKDFTESALLQDMEAPMFQSISESCCSLNSDTPESFLRKVSYNGSFRSNGTRNDIKEGGGERESGVMDVTFQKDKSIDKSDTNSQDSTFTPTSHRAESNSQSSPNSTILNGTYRKTPKRNATFRKADNPNRLSLNLTYDKQLNIYDNKEVSKSIETDIDKYTEDLDSTRTIGDTNSTKIIKRTDSVEELKRRYSNMDLNKLSYCQEGERNLEDDEFGDKEVEFERPVENERLSLGSAESLDRTSSLSNSSRGSNKMLNIGDIDDLTVDRGRVLPGLMSTPKVNMGVDKLWENNFLSPIVSLDKQTKSTLYSRVSNVDTYIKQTDSNKDTKMRRIHRTENISNQRPLQALPINFKGSYNNISNLKTASSNFGGSQPRLSKPSSRNSIRPPSASNLKTMGSQLKGSYTSLRPISANLPVAPPVGVTPNVVQMITRPNAKTENFPKEKVFAVPTIPVSALPRPTGIPRPQSRIPGLRSQNTRPASSKGLHY
ncbi:uncharacterized protein LOC115875869 isoform X1 [Sitophilus oryzae]|uniref:Uncharacterized protein LOC115875869 isoform X1 n=1 Tax=Sitophilus oryzae TaxID=7048 RepID=A0A6J2X8T6_SITOR|nr:uncharacterized protein LOC115875869 isoform X1 [Sitophilus oryzae]